MSEDGLPSGYLDLIITHTLKVFHRLDISTGEPQYIKRVNCVVCAQTLYGVTKLPSAAFARVVTQQSSVFSLTSTELLIQFHCTSQVLKVHAFICQSLTFCSMTQPFIWCSRFPRRCAQNMEHYTSSHPPIPNILFLQTSP